MKKCLFPLSLGLMIIMLGSCCQKKMCIGNKIGYVRFYDFQYNDLDSVEIRKFEIATNTMIEQYAYYNKQKQGNGYIEISLGPELDDFDEPLYYTVFLPQTNQEFNITDLTYTDDQCKSGMCKQEYRSLSSYKVNGTLQQFQDFILRITN